MAVAVFAADEPVDAFRAVVRSRDVKEYSAAALKLRRWMIANDPYYPKYHFVAPESWINDPNGPIYFDGRYHLFYQFDPIVDGRRSKRCWGHAVSSDLIHWKDWPVALWPDTPEDRNGVFSGNTFVAGDSSLCALYTGNVASHKESHGILARSTDGGLTWRKKVVMPNSRRPNADSPAHWDGFVWRESEM
jgi:beta-fructofuranosidase